MLAGASGALFAVVVPAMLVTRISALDLSIWTVVLQAALYVAPFALGIQGVLSRQIALRSERGAHQEVHETMGAAFRVLGLGMAVYLSIGCLVVVALGDIYPDLPAARLHEAQATFAIFLIGQATLIPVAGMAGYFFGIQRHLAITVNVLGSKLLASIGIVGLSGHFNLVVLSSVATLITLTANAWLYLAYRRSIRLRFGSPQQRTGSAAALSKQMLKDCAPISLWALATFAIYSGTTTIAGIADFANFPAYSMATAAVLVLMGFHAATMNPLIPHVTIVDERGGPAAVGATLERASVVSACISGTVLLLYAALGHRVLQLALPDRLGSVMATLMPILLCGNVIRLLGLPYSNTLIGLGLQGRILWTPVTEALTTVSCALLLAPHFGLPGIAASIGIGGIVSLLVHFGHNMPMTAPMVPVRRLRTFLSSLFILSPGVAALFAMG